MALANYAASVQGVALRIGRLDANGVPLTGPLSTVYVTRAFMRLSFTPEYEEGDEVTEKNAAGEVCITYKAPDTLKRCTMELAICEPDPEITELLNGGVLLQTPGTPGTPATGATPAIQGVPGITLGYASERVGEAPNQNGVSIEVWSLAIRDGARDNDYPYYHWVFPKAFLRPGGDRVIENGVLANTFEGYGVGNLSFGTGPMDTWLWPDATDRPYSYARMPEWDMPWTGINGWVDNSAIVHDKGATQFLPGTISTPNVEYGVITSVSGPCGPAGIKIYPREALASATGPTGPTGAPIGPTAPTAAASGPTVFAADAEAPTGPSGPAAKR